MLIFGARIMSFKSLGVMETVSMLYEVTSKPVSRGLSKVALVSLDHNGASCSRQAVASASARTTHNG